MNPTTDDYKNFTKHKSIEDLKDIRNISYSPDGKFLAISTDGSLRVYDALSGNISTVISLDINNFTHFTENTILFLKDKEIKYLSLYDNKYLNIFQGHLTKINNIYASSLNDSFVTSSEQDVNIWDIKSKNPIYHLKIKNAIGSFVDDRFLLASNSIVKIYDIRNINNCLKTIKIIQSDYQKIESCRDYFSISGNKMHQIYNKEGEFITPIKTVESSYVTFTPDTKHYTCSAGQFLIFNDTTSKNKLFTMKDEANHFGNVLFNPCYLQFVSTNEKLNFWMPGK